MTIALSNSPTAYTLFTADFDGRLKSWAIKKGKDLLKDYGKVHTDSIVAMVVTSDDGYLFTVSSDCTMKKFDLGREELDFDYGVIHEGKVLTVVVSKDDRFVWTGGVDWRIRKWSATGRLGVLVVDYGLAHNSWVTCLKIFGDDSCLVSGSVDCHLVSFFFFMIHRKNGMLRAMRYCLILESVMITGSLALR